MSTSRFAPDSVCVSDVHPLDDEVTTIFPHNVLVEESESIIGGVISGVRPKLESIGLSLLCLHKILIPALPYAGDHVGFVIASSGIRSHKYT
jgi:hypothetical protein